MKRGLLISDTGPIFSLCIIRELYLLETFFDEFFIPEAVWVELTKDKNTKFYPEILSLFKDRVKKVSSPVTLLEKLDLGESEAITLYKDYKADYLLIDDKKARSIAEEFGIKCIGTIGVLIAARKNGLIKELRPLFHTFLNNKRFYSKSLLNRILLEFNEKVLV